jgi:hypothetical protein
VTSENKPAVKVLSEKTGYVDNFQHDSLNSEMVPVSIDGLSEEFRDLSRRRRFTETSTASTNSHLLKLGNGTTDALNEHLYTDHGENQTHHSRNDLDAVVSDVFNDAFA